MAYIHNTWDRVKAVYIDIHREVLSLYQNRVPNRQYILLSSSEILKSLRHDTDSFDNNALEIKYIESLIESIYVLRGDIKKSYDGLHEKHHSDIKLYDNFISILDGFERLLDIVRERKDTINTINQKIILPQEIPAPVKVVLSENKISLASPKHHTGIVPDASVDRIRQGTRDIFERLLEELNRSSNIDPRLYVSCQGLLKELSLSLENASIEAIGLNWQILNETLDVTQDTVPEAVLVQIRRVLKTVHTILLQYEEWRLYISAEIGTKLTPAEIIALADETVKLANDLADVPEAVEPRIVDRLTNMTDAVSIGIVQAEGLGVALVGSVSNLLATLSHVALNYLPNSFTNATLAQLPAPTSAAALSGMVLLSEVAIRVIKMFAPTFAQFAPFSWIIGVHTEIVKYSSYFRDFLKR